ncbi:t-SNARE [Thelephora terrestris]|uniref:t-SNARE n=1 Tax=Thelephora terrestris TaxID=56493 RepID=A0A9P6L8F7_9AGAM|nr:t-SNARE [Thelephora terrestris]
MSQDPYHAVQREIQTSLQTSSTLRASYLRIRSTARDESEELVWARNELKATLAAMEADLEDLEESVKIVEETGPRMFGLEESDVMERRRYVNFVKQEIETIRSELETGVAKPRSRPSSWVAPRETAKPSPPTVTPDDAEEDSQSEWARAEQQMMIREQDRTIDSIAGTLSTLAQQAGLMGQEIVEHNEMLDDIEQGVDRSNVKLDGAMKRMRKFIHDTEETKSGWCILILIIVLLVLLLAVILV